MITEPIWVFVVQAIVFLACGAIIGAYFQGRG